MPKLNTKKVTIGQLRTLAPEEQKKIIAPIIEANQKQFADLAKSISSAVGIVKGASSFTSYFQNLADSFKLPDMSGLYDPISRLPQTYVMPVGKSDWEIEQEQKQAYLTDLHIQLLEAQLAIAKGAQTPQYDISTGIIKFMGKEIEIPLNTNLEMVARIVLKNVENMKRKWSWDEIVEENREDSSLYDDRKIYIAARAINDKVAQATAIKDFIICKPTSTVQLNPDFLPK